ncbi:nucleotide exchange factor GrpE [Flavobacterium salilacus subsp. salilacus]|uniref:nucleotide exchange factor GrpE n=1 Tax=Flavobacterium TaxID=237 RepID=UPI00107548C5|nr:MULTISPECIES: nucleotide exchange factor GrpE [Flavobacterium]KAF2519462.1 nucleotide exchange factor GrpE [Flavobacterium salilacus subsp. salilacus]MBE1614642.1 nucleotide exchange factor GrpE [Flavobacterium sp. SaA2.13]NDI98291.1 nucleotide exchange factor GrpE [Flavobacterium salilacus subsp. altitudinum]
MFKKIFKNMSQDNSENKEKDSINEDIATNNENETTSEPEAGIPSAEELTEEEKLREELAKEKDKFLRLFAEFENYKKRTSKERIELFKTANQEVLVALLPVMDDFDRALAEIVKTEDEVLLKGVELIHNKFRDTLKSKGLEQVELKAGDNFDADFAEAITQIPAPSEELKGKIVDVVEKGYKLGDKIIRFPKVVLGN